MLEPAVICKGIEIEGFSIPPFVLMPGNTVCLQWPVNEHHPGFLAFLDVLTGKTPSASMVINGKVGVCKTVQFRWKLFGSSRLADLILPHLPYGVLKLLGFPNHFDFLKRLQQWHLLHYYLQEDGKLTRIAPELEAHIRAIVAKSEAPLTSLQASDRNFIAFSERAADSDIIVFDVNGCSPARFHSKIAGKASGKALIELRFPIISRHESPPFQNAPRLVIQPTFEAPAH